MAAGPTELVSPYDLPSCFPSSVRPSIDWLRLRSYLASFTECRLSARLHARRWGLLQTASIFRPCLPSPHLCHFSAHQPEIHQPILTLPSLKALGGPQSPCQGNVILHLDSLTPLSSTNDQWDLVDKYPSSFSAQVDDSEATSTLSPEFPSKMKLQVPT